MLELCERCMTHAWHMHDTCMTHALHMHYRWNVFAVAELRLYNCLDDSNSVAVSNAVSSQDCGGQGVANVIDGEASTKLLCSVAAGLRGAWTSALTAHHRSTCRFQGLRARPLTPAPGGAP